MKYTFENPGKNALMAEILTRRSRKPRMAVLASLAAVIIASAVSFTALSGSLTTAAVPPADRRLNSAEEELPAEIVKRVHTETQTEPVTVYNEVVVKSETAEPIPQDAPEYPDKGVALFSQPTDGTPLCQWRYRDEVFTFYAKDQALYRRSERTGATAVMYRGEGEVSVVGLTDRYLFFTADEPIAYTEYFGNNTYCFRADLITGDVLRLFNCHTNYYPYDISLYFVQTEGTDVVFNEFIVHEDGSYERIPSPLAISDDTEYSEPQTLQWAADGCLLWGDYTDTGVSRGDIEAMVGEGDITTDRCILSDSQRIYATLFEEAFGMEPETKKYLFYVGQITDDGLDGGLIQAELTSFGSLNCPFDMVLVEERIEVRNMSEVMFSIPIDFEKLLAAEPGEPEEYPFEEGRSSARVVYRPISSLSPATDDSAKKI